MGLCPDCLLAAGLGSVADATAAGAAKHFVPPEIEELAPLFPQLEIDRLLGCGGMGAVYKARQKNLDRSVALKILPPDIGRDPAFAARFAREAKALAKLNHPNIVTLYEFGQAGDLFYFLMEYVDGVNLRQLIHEGRVASREALAIVPQICDALQYAHDQGIVHRDIKPENILLDRRGRVKVADFGLAKLVRSADQTDQSDRTVLTDHPCEVSQPSLLMGTPAYMAPEQREHPAEVDHRADIYSLGVVFYQMLTGELPGKSLEAPSKKVTIDVRLDEVVLRALEQRPERRYQQVSEVRTSLETIGIAPSSKASAAIEQGGKPGYASAIVFFILYAAYVAMVLATIDTLPARVATHFGFEGRADGWMSRSGYQLFELAFPLGIALILTGVSALVRFIPAQFVNLPRKDYWLVPERRALTAAMIRSRMTWLACLMTLFFGGLHMLTLEANRVQPPQLPMGGLLMIMMFFLISLMLWVILLLMRFAETGEGSRHVPQHSPSVEKNEGTRSGNRLLLVVGVVAAVFAIFGVKEVKERWQARSNPVSLADSPQRLRKLPTAQLIEVSLAKPISPWGWQVLESRSLTQAEAGRIMEGMTAWVQRETSNSRSSPLHWADSFLAHLEKCGLLNDEQKIRFLVALHGNLRPEEPSVRLREGADRLQLMAECRYIWNHTLFGFEIMNAVQSVTVDGQQVKAENHSSYWNVQDLNFTVPLPALTPGKHTVKLEVLSALVAKDDLTGLASGAPPAEWPPAKKRWTRSVETELVVYPRDAVIVSQTDDPALDPVRNGNLSAKSIILRPKGNKTQAVLSFNMTDTLPVPISFDVALRIAGQTVPCGQLWSIKRASGRTGSGEEMTVELSQVAPDIKEADIVLTPNPAPVEQFPSVDRIWGTEVVFWHVPLIRQDVPGGVSVQTKSPAGAHGAEVETSFVNSRNPSGSMSRVTWAKGVLLIMGGLFLLIIMAPIIGMVIWIRKAKPGPGKSVAVGCGVVFLVGLVLLLLLVGLSFAWFSFTRGNAMHEADAQQQHAKDEVIRRHQQQKIEREEATKEVQ
jgi:serine/threonine protein kinase